MTRQRLHLITPHGDRKPYPARPAAVVVAGLITPHGDRKPEEIVTRTYLTPYSLPLMGIGNSSVAARTAARISSCSLPLMGIGNCAEGWRRQSWCGAHYPSWGSETSLEGAMALRAVKTSLPLMGIGNTRPARRSTSTCRCSLPLMGIGNELPSLDILVARPQLITPHGDRKPPIYRSLRVLCGLHMPKRPCHLPQCRLMSTIRAPGTRSRQGFLLRRRLEDSQQ